MKPFVLISDGNNLIFKHDDEAYKFTSCSMTGFKVDMNMDGFFNIDLQLVSNNYVKVTDIKEDVKEIIDNNANTYGFRDLDI